MKVSIEGLIKRLDDLTERLNDLFDKLEQEEIEIEDVDEYFRNDDTFNLSIALDVLKQADKLDKALEIISEKEIDIVYFKVCFKNGLGYKNYNFMIAVARRFITEEEYNTLGEVLL